jgi:Fe2+ or Zn2+ uptake regulation protein
MVARGRTEARKDFLAFLANKKRRLTRQRRVIIDTVFGANEHFTADQLLAWARGRDASVSRATVYRTLPLLVVGGWLQQLDLGKNETIYDPTTPITPLTAISSAGTATRLSNSKANNWPGSNPRSKARWDFTSNPSTSR